MAEEEKSSGKSMTVFKNDRHEDWAAIVFAALVAASVLIYMAFIVSDIPFKAPADGKILSVKVAENTAVKNGDLLLVLETKEKKQVGGAVKEEVVQKEIKSKLSGKVTKVLKKDGDEVKKDKDVIMVFAPERGKLP